VESVEHLGTRKGNIRKSKLMRLELIIKTKILRDFYRGINEFKKWYKPRITIIKDGNGNLLADPQTVLKGGKISLTSY
jgi:hypothetical protein